MIKMPLKKFICSVYRHLEQLYAIEMIAIELTSGSPVHIRMNTIQITQLQTTRRPGELESIFEFLRILCLCENCTESSLAGTSRLCISRVLIDWLCTHVPRNLYQTLSRDSQVDPLPTVSKLKSGVTIV